MNDSVIALLVLLPVGVLTVLCCLAIHLMDFFYKRREKILQEKYPTFYAKREAMYAASADSLCGEMVALKGKIDQLMEELPYLPIEQVDASQMQIEVIKKEYQQVKAKDRINDLKIDRYHKEMMDIYKATPDLQKFYKWEIRD